MRRAGLIEEIWSRRHTSSLIQNHLRCFSEPQTQVVPRNVRVVSKDRKHVLAWHKVNLESEQLQCGNFSRVTWYVRFETEALRTSNIEPLFEINIGFGLILEEDRMRSIQCFTIAFGLFRKYGGTPSLYFR